MFGITYVVLWLLILAQGAVIIALIRELSELRAQMGVVSTSASDLPSPIGGPAPHFMAVDIATKQANTSRELTVARQVHIFLSTECKLCAQIAADLSSRRDLLGSLAMYCVGDEKECRRRLSSFAPLAPCFLVTRRDVSGFGFAGFPAMATFDAHGNVADIRYPSGASEIWKYLLHLAAVKASATPAPSASVPVAVEGGTHAA